MTLNESVDTRGVSRMSSTSSAGCHLRGAGEITPIAPAPWGYLVAPVPLLAPRITVDVVAVRLPEARLLLLVEPDLLDPLGALPEIEMRHQHARRTAVLGRQGLAVVLVDDPRLAVHQVLERQVGRVAAE